LWRGRTGLDMTGWERTKRRTSSGNSLEPENPPPFTLLAHWRERRRGRDGEGKKREKRVEEMEREKR
jgi:hypothetical protein